MYNFFMFQAPQSAEDGTMFAAQGNGTAFKLPPTWQPVRLCALKIQRVERARLFFRNSTVAAAPVTIPVMKLKSWNLLETSIAATRLVPWLTMSSAFAASSQDCLSLRQL